MRNEKDHLGGNVFKGLIAVALCLQLPLMARADDATELKPATPATQNIALTPQSGEAAANVFKLAAQKLSSGATLSAEEYRALGVGCTGFEADRTYFQKIGKVTDVYPGSPAEKAGIRVGDKLVYNEPDNQQAIDDPTTPQWEVKLGRAGTPIDVTLLRHGKPVTMTLVRENIEDIEDAKYRERWEKVVRDVGYQTEGTFTGIGKHPDYSANRN